jgi:uncharacterized protein YcbX
LFSYPVKSCAAISHRTTALDAFGLAWDRRWMLVDAAGHFASQRSVPGLAQIVPLLTAETLQLAAPGQADLQLLLHGGAKTTREVSVWSDRVLAWDEGDIAADWFTRFAGVPLRLVRFPDTAVRPVSRQYATLPGSTTAFADGFPLLLATEESLADLNHRLGQRGATSVPMNRFRPNVVLAGADRPYAEDDWLALQLDDLQLDIVKPCTRCVITTTDQVSGKIPEPGEPLATLSTYRRWGGNVVFTQNVIAHGRGPIQVGAPVRIALQGVRNRWQIGSTEV